MYVQECEYDNWRHTGATDPASLPSSARAGGRAAERKRESSAVGGRARHCGLRGLRLCGLRGLREWDAFARARHSRRRADRCGGHAGSTTGRGSDTGAGIDTGQTAASGSGSGAGTGRGRADGLLEAERRHGRSERRVVRGTRGNVRGGRGRGGRGRGSGGTQCRVLRECRAEGMRGDQRGRVRRSRNGIVAIIRRGMRSIRVPRADLGSARPSRGRTKTRRSDGRMAGTGAAATHAIGAAGGIRPLRRCDSRHRRGARV